uniref:Uncharacterized protein n=1 Tax=Eubacterium cellulosolvens (strain ATCC 43171 / JCM 9499 / 6) TaxID=633697 RepID=I5AWT5_EUBC6
MQSILDRKCSSWYLALKRFSLKLNLRKTIDSTQMSEALLTINSEAEADEYSIPLCEDTTLYFTQTHVAEIQEILKLLTEYGEPAEEEMDADEESVGGPLLHPMRRRVIDEHITQDSIYSSHNSDNRNLQDYEESNGVATAGSVIRYKKLFANDMICDTVLQPGKYPLHKKFEGHRIGDVILFLGKEYEIIGL